MTLTNNYNLPQVLLTIAERDLYEPPHPHRYSVTELLKPIKEIILWRRYYDKIEQDISELIPSLFGTAFHTMLEVADNGQTEQRVSAEIFPGVVLSGRYDKVENYTLTDYKTVTVSKYMRGDFEDYRKQGLMYAWLLRNDSVYIDKLEFYLFLKDHSIMRGRNQEAYPKHAIALYEYVIKSEDMHEIGQYIKSRIAEIEKYIDTPDKELPMPTHDESWYSGDKFAVMKRNGSRAVKLCDTQTEADSYIRDGKGDYVEVRYGEHIKSLYSEFFKYYVMEE